MTPPILDISDMIRVKSEDISLAIKTIMESGIMDIEYKSVYSDMKLTNTFVNAMQGYEKSMKEMLVGKNLQYLSQILKLHIEHKKDMEKTLQISFDKTHPDIIIKRYMTIVKKCLMPDTCTKCLFDAKTMYFETKLSELIVPKIKEVVFERRKQMRK